MKPNELIKILDSGVVHNLRINYCGGRIDVNPKHAPFELPDYEIVKLWADDRGYICVLLADGIAAEREPAPESAADEKEINDETAYNAVKTLKLYCSGILNKNCREMEVAEVCNNCIFYKNKQCQIANIFN